MAIRNPPPGSQSAASGEPLPLSARGLPSEEDRYWALGAHVATIPTGMVGPLVIWYLKRDDSPFAAYHAVQAFWWSTGTLLLWVVVSIVTCGAAGLLLPAIWLASVYVGLQAKEGTWQGYWGMHKLGVNGQLTP